MPTQKLGRLFDYGRDARQGRVACILPQRSLYFLQEKSSVSSFYPVASLTVAPTPYSNNKKHLEKSKLEREKTLNL